MSAACCFGSRSGATGPRSGTGRRPLGLAVDVVAIVVAGVAFAEVAVSGVSADGRTDPLAALAPGLLALGLGVAGARLLPLMAGATIPMTRNSPRVGTALATRRVARLPHLSRQVVVLSVAVGLALFAVSGWAVAGHNRMVVSEFEVGAAKVLTVQVHPGVQFEQAVRRADPTGHGAMAVVVEHGSDGETLAVDSPRFAAVASWPAGLTPKSATAVAAAIAGTSVPTVMLGERAIRVSVDMSRNVVPAPQLQATVFDDAYDSQTTVGLGSLRPGSHDYQASIVGDCAGSCRLVSLGVTWSPPENSSVQTVDVPFRITSLAAESPSGSWTPLAAGLTRPHHWRSLSAGVVLASSPRGLTVRAVVDATGGATAFGPADVPPALPAVVIGSGPGVDLGVGLDGATIPLKPVASVVALPGVGPAASLVDLTLAERTQSGPMIDTTKQVWLAAGASHAIVPRLEAEGIVPLSAVTAVERDEALSQSGISLAYEFFVLAAVGAALLAVGSTAFALVAVARRRIDELADLHAVGLGRSVLRRSLAIEQGLVVGFGMVLGIAAGLAATAVALPSIPEFGSSIAGPPLDVRPPFGLVGLTVLAVVVVIGRHHLGDHAGLRQPVHHGRSGERRVTTSSAEDTRRRGIDVQVRGVIHLYQQDGPDIVALRGIDLDIGAGEMVALLGPSGMGKSTLMQLMAGVMRPSAGHIRVGDVDLGQLSATGLRRLRASEVSFVLQDTPQNLLPYATAVENVWFAQQGNRRGREAEDPFELLSLLGLADLAHQRVGDLPSGQQQLVALASGVAPSPACCWPTSPPTSSTPRRRHRSSRCSTPSIEVWGPPSSWSPMTRSWLPRSPAPSPSAMGGSGPRVGGACSTPSWTGAGRSSFRLRSSSTFPR